MAMGMLFVSASCTRLLDHQRAQCHNDDDCQVFSYHPFCNKTTLVCEPSGLAPEHCFYSTPTHPPVEPLDFLNRCTHTFLPGGPQSPLGACLTFDRGIDEGATITDPPPPAPPPPIDRTAPVGACAKLAPPGKTVIYITGSSNFQPLLQELAEVVVEESNLIPVFRITTSCTGVRSMNSKSPTYNTEHFIRDPVSPSDNYAQIFLGDGGPGLNCTLDGGSTGVPVDVGESEIYPATCDALNSVEDTIEHFGPILPIEFVVPKGSSQVAISYAAARQVFGGGGGVAPWNEPSLIFVRGAGTATLRLVARQLDLMPAQVWGRDQGSAGHLASQLAVNGESAAAIGIIGADFYDSVTNRDTLRALAFQADHQGCAFLPDASFLTLDKINVRDGHYPLWGRIHLFTARVSAADLTPAERFALLLTSSKLDQRILEAFIDAHFVPPCAMKVRRDTELGPLTWEDSAPNSCGCAFDAHLRLPGSPPPPDCMPCESNEDCPSERPLCSYKFCERSR